MVSHYKHGTLLHLCNSESLLMSEARKLNQCRIYIGMCVWPNVRQGRRKQKQLFDRSIHVCTYCVCVCVWVCVVCLSWLHFHTCFVSEPNCNCCLSNKYAYMQLRSPEVTRANFHLSLMFSLERAAQSLASLHRSPFASHNPWAWFIWMETNACHV